MNRARSRLKRLELLSSIGAGVLGAGVGLLLAEWLQSFVIPVLVIGLVTHGWSMYQRGRAEQQEGLVQPTWTSITEGVCWVILAALVLYIGYAMLRGGAALP